MSLLVWGIMFCSVLLSVYASIISMLSCLVHSDIMSIHTHSTSFVFACTKQPNSLLRFLYPALKSLLENPPTSPSKNIQSKLSLSQLGLNTTILLHAYDHTTHHNLPPPSLYTSPILLMQGVLQVRRDCCA